MDALIQFQNVTKIYQPDHPPAVQDASFDVYRGETVALLGPSGCGKTTTLKLINRLEEPTSGRILLEGVDIAQQDPLELRRNIGYVIQDVGLFPHLSIAENVATVPHLKRWPRQKTEERVDELLQLVGLDPETYRQRLPEELSGGQQQRAGVARALAADPSLMLMDEPFGALDPINRLYLQTEFLKIQERVQKTVVLVTHDIDEAVRLGDRIVIMRQGRVVQYDTAQNILRTPADEFVANLTGDDRAIRYLGLVPVKQAAGPPLDSAPPAGGGGSVSPDESLKAALGLMLESGVTRLVVVDASGEVAGELTLQQLVETVAVAGRQMIEEAKGGMR